MSTDPYGFFDVAWHDVGQDCAAPWRPMSELATASTAWTERIAATRDALGASVGVQSDEVELRVAASVAHLGVCARIIAPALGVAVLDGRVMETALEQTWWQPTLGGPFPLSVQRASAERLTSAQLIWGLRGGLVDITMSSLARAVRPYSVSSVIAWGNVASALHSAAAMLAQAHPQRTVEIDSIRTGLATHEPLAAAGHYTADGDFRRNSCCLIYRVTGCRPAPVCGDCVLVTTDHHTSPSRQSQVISASRSSGTATGNT